MALIKGNFISGYKHSKKLIPIWKAREDMLERRVLDSFRNLQDIEVGLGGGLAIPFLLRLYSQSISRTYELLDYPVANRMNPDELIKSWMPQSFDGMKGYFYRNHSGIIHYLCFEQDLTKLVDVMKKEGYDLYHRVKMISFGKFSDIKFDDVVEIKPEEVIAQRNIWNKQKFTSRALRFMKKEDVKRKMIGRYFDVFVHHYESDKGNLLIKRDKSFYQSVNGAHVSPSEVYVVSNKEGIKLPLESFQFLKLNIGDMRLMLGNPLYIYEIKKKFLGNDEDLKHTSDLEVVDSMLQFLGKSQIDQIRS